MNNEKATKLSEKLRYLNDEEAKATIQHYLNFDLTTMSVENNVLSGAPFETANHWAVGLYYRDPNGGEHWECVGLDKAEVSESEARECLLAFCKLLTMSGPKFCAAMELKAKAMGTPTATPTAAPTKKAVIKVNGDELLQVSRN